MNPKQIQLAVEALERIEPYEQTPYGRLGRFRVESVRLPSYEDLRMAVRMFERRGYERAEWDRSIRGLQYRVRGLTVEWGCRHA